MHKAGSQARFRRERASISAPPTRRNSAARRSGVRFLNSLRQSTNISRRTCSATSSGATTSTGEPAKSPPSPRGGENTAYAKYFSGKSYLARLTEDGRLNVPVANVTFEPGCRNNWHSHTGGQMLIAVGGIGYYQERGKTARRLVPGDVVEIPPDVDHWHGAAPDSWFSHLAIECNPATNKNTWLEPVSDADYKAATSGK